MIAATNKPLDALRGPGGFRDDFYYRLCSDTITVPPLRQRFREDPRELDALLGHIMARVAGKPLPSCCRSFANGLRDLLQPLRVARQCARARASRPPHSAHAQLYGRTRCRATDRASQLAAAVAAGTLDADALLGGYCALLYERCGNLEEVARRTNLDRRTVKRYLAQGHA